MSKLPNAGYVRFRRGIIEHVRDGRMTWDEFAAYGMLLLLADHRNGLWMGCGGGLASALKVCERKGRYLLKSLAGKGYIRLPEKTPAHGLYPVQICKYFNTRHGGAVSGLEAAQKDGLRRHGGAAIQEVKTLQEEKRQEGNRTPFHTSPRTRIPFYDAVNERPISEATATRVLERYAQRERLAPVAAKRSL